MDNSVKIPGTSWEVILQPNNSIAGNIDIVFSKNNSNQKRYTLEKDGSILDIVSKFQGEVGIVIPKNREEYIINQLEPVLFELEENTNESFEKKTLQSMMNLSEMQDKKILISGLAGAGKTSIYKVVFEGAKWWELQNLPPTRGIQRYKHGHRVERSYNLFVWDLGGQERYLKQYHKEAEKIFTSASALAFVVDTYDVNKLEMAREELVWTISTLLKYVKKPHIFVFLHKMDQFSKIEEKFEGMKEFFMESVIKITNLNVEPTFIATSIKDDSIFEAWEQIFKIIIPKSKNLNMLAENLKNQLGIYNVLVLEKRTGFPICASSNLFDDVVLVGTINKLWESVNKLVNDLELVNLEKFSVQCENGFLWVEEFGENLILMGITPNPEISRKHDNKLKIEEFKKDIMRYL